MSSFLIGCADVYLSLYWTNVTAEQCFFFVACYILPINGSFRCFLPYPVLCNRRTNPRNFVDRTVSMSFVWFARVRFNSSIYLFPSLLKLAQARPLLWNRSNSSNPHPNQIFLLYSMVDVYFRFFSLLLFIFLSFSLPTSLTLAVLWILWNVLCYAFDIRHFPIFPNNCRSFVVFFGVKLFDSLFALHIYFTFSLPTTISSKLP